MPLRIEPATARAFLVRRHGLTAESRWADARAAVDGLGYVQIDPIQVVERNHHLVLQARVAGYAPAHLDRLLYAERSLIEAVTTVRCIVPTVLFPHFLPRFRELEQRYRPGLKDFEPMFEAIERAIGARGPMSSRCFDSRDKVQGWWDREGKAGTRAISQALEWLWHFGRLVIHHRHGNLRFFDLTGRVLPGISAGAADDPDFLARAYFRAAGLASSTDPHLAWSRQPPGGRRKTIARLVGAGELIPVAVGSLADPYYLSAELESELRSPGDCGGDGVKFLPPLDNLIICRRRAAELFDFQYRWEAYVPRERRTYGSYAMAILHGDRLAGRFAPRLDRRRGALVVRGPWWEGQEVPGGFASALEEWARFHGARAIEFERSDCASE
ncbi:MAG TPA: crosslink repair DNA glycosylase YcaQ family protein [Bacillota bacterium]|nr:crosslink repair DNA glycosylase YcaQ family protein [Bacillota bacterium]